jgi:hypothetical protein
MVATFGLIEPAPVVVHEIVHATHLPVPGVEQEGEAGGEHAAVDPVTAPALQLQDSNQEPRDVVDAVARRPVGNGPDKATADVVDEAEQMIRPQLRPQLR